MSTYPKWWTDTVTIYHRTMDSGRVVWTRSTATGAYVTGKRGGVTNLTDMHRKGDRMICRLRYPAPYIGVGDIVVRGLITDTIDEYTAGARSTDLMRNYAGMCGQVTEYHDNTHDGVGLKHVYVGAD